MRGRGIGFDFEDQMSTSSAGRTGTQKARPRSPALRLELPASCRDHNQCLT